MSNIDAAAMNSKIDPNAVPQRTLFTGAKMPAIGMGTFGNDKFTDDEVAIAVKGAIDYGYRLFDCAAAYGNEVQIGNSFKEAIDSGVKREDLFVISKLWNNMHGKRDVLLACAKTLKDLQLDYLDMYLVHWPFDNTHPKGAEPGYRDPGARPYSHERYMETWYQMERLVEMGLVRHIGTSNMTLSKLKGLMKDAKIKPAANEVEMHPVFQQPELFKYCIDNNIQIIGYAPIGSPERPDRDKDEEDYVAIQDPIVVKIAKAHNVHTAVICLKWAVQRGQIPVPSTIFPNEYQSNLRCTVEDPLSDAEMKEIEGTDKNCRLIKGKVFLWKDAKDWKDLWE